MVAVRVKPAELGVEDRPFSTTALVELGDLSHLDELLGQRIGIFKCGFQLDTFKLGAQRFGRLEGGLEDGRVSLGEKRGRLVL